MLFLFSHSVSISSNQTVQKCCVIIIHFHIHWQWINYFVVASIYQVLFQHLSQKFLIGKLNGTCTSVKYTQLYLCNLTALHQESYIECSFFKNSMCYV